jgi:hypothetical protein
MWIVGIPFKGMFMTEQMKKNMAEAEPMSDKQKIKIAMYTLSYTIVLWYFWPYIPLSSW